MKACERDFRGARPSRALVAASRRDGLRRALVSARAPRYEDLPACSAGAEFLPGRDVAGSPSRRDAATSARDGRAPRYSAAARLVTIVWLLIFAPALTQAAEKAKGYEAFSLVRTRNIFDPNRRPPKKESEQPRVVAPSKPRSVHLALTGTMVTEGKSLAFFSGSRSEFNKIISVGDKIGDFKLVAITGAQVDLEQGGKPVVLTVGKRMQLEGTEADAAEPEPAAPTADAPATSPDPSKPSAPAGSPPTGGSPSDILKRMMERRAKEMNK